MKKKSCLCGWLQEENAYVFFSAWNDYSKTLHINQTEHRRRQLIILLGLNVHLNQQSRVWSLSHQQQLCVGNVQKPARYREVWQISFCYDFWYYKTSWVPMNKLSNSHSSSLQCYMPASAEATSQRGSGNLRNRSRRRVFPSCVWSPSKPSFHWEVQLWHVAGLCPA